MALSEPTLKFFGTGTSGSPALVPLEAIPEWLKKQAEEVYAAIKQTDGRMRVELASKAEVDEYATLLKSYCEQRPDGRIVFRRSPSRGLAENMMDFRISDPQPEKAEESTGNASPSAPAKKAVGRPRKNAA